MSRAARAAEVAALRASGLSAREVAAELGIGHHYVHELLRDPEGIVARARHERARGRCADCGGPTAWPGKGSAPSVRCKACHDRRRAAVCGTASRYKRGCRCDACRRANTEWQRDYQRRQREAAA